MLECDILIIDDEIDIRDLVSGILEDEGYKTLSCANSEEAIDILSKYSVKLVFLDVWLDDSRLDGLALLNYIKNNYSEIPVIMISGHGTIDTAVSAIKRGAYDFIEKPFNSDRLLLAVERALETSMLRKQVNDLKVKNSENLTLIGESPVMKKLRNNIAKIALTNSRILLRGASGTGKELISRIIHASSNRAKQPFVVVSCANITEDNVDEILFGSERNNQKSVIGAIEKAHQGTLYLDGISDLPLIAQAKLLKWLSTNSFCRTGGSDEISPDVRVISSSYYSLEEMVSRGLIREDLYHRLCVVLLVVPSLEERRDDIPQLTEYFIKYISAREGIKPRIITSDALEILQGYDWPGNVRQLRNNIERLLILAGNSMEDKEITAQMLPPEVCDPLSKEVSNNIEKMMSMQLREARELFEKKYLIAKIEMFGGNISKTADDIGMERSALHRKLKSLNIQYKD